MSTSASALAWTFFRTGGLDQVALTAGSDLLALEQLDQKLWVALSGPVKGLELGEKTLALIDSDNDGRNFADFYAHDRWALFQSGTLYLDRRSTELCVRVNGPSPLAAKSKTCIADCA